MGTASGQKSQQGPTPRDISELAPEDLMKLRVTSAANKEQALSKVGAALFVITREDIASSGANNIPDLLRLVPGVEVAQIDSNQWAISIRGFNSFSSNKVLALIDGRALYQPLFSGVLWDQQDLPLEDIERIEVIRGPGATVWGANAMNGVINIITRHTRDTKGGLVTTGAGSWRAGEALVQYGGDVGSVGTYRTFGKYFDVRSSLFPDQQAANDGWHSWAGGFRSDWDLTPRDTLTVQGDVRTTVAGGTSLATFSEPRPVQAVINSPVRNTLGDVMGTWRHSLAGGSETTLRVFYDHIERNGEAATDVTNDTIDVDFEHHLAIGARNDVVWGLNARVNIDHIRAYGSHSLEVTPARSTVPFVSGFFQDEIRLANSLFLTLGSKLEHNDYTGLEYEPGAQLVWTLSERHTLWTSASRAIRQPNRVDFGGRFNVGVAAINDIPAVLTLSGNSAIKAEQLFDYEAGYRGQIHPRLGFGLATFLSYYRNLETTEAGQPLLVVNPGIAPYFVIPVAFANLARARNYGAELYFHWTAARRWTLSPGYSFLQMSVQQDPGSRDAARSSISGYSAKHRLQVRSVLNLRPNVEWSATVRYVSRLATPKIASYVTADTTLRWRPRDDLEFSITGQNLLTPGRLEFSDLTMILIPSQVRRNAFAKLAWRF
ncbi:MAG: ligand-gated TonB-dependent outer rane channel [Bryobacterales bacterium]|nr:ligand-gated TonB-dependent outer rane channel [Bryobacterales bacterium]